ncbi:hypothetical protein [Lactobacillus terrae]|uniref:hypothetical protein n=1 Tax=Lactobacillus terrae TaxID=2269374 RepID=UPI000C1B7884|nr:hypothetical protein [Lactobacillus terrae]
MNKFETIIENVLDENDALKNKLEYSNFKINLYKRIISKNLDTETSSRVVDVMSSLDTLEDNGVDFKSLIDGYDKDIEITVD